MGQMRAGKTVVLVMNIFGFAFAHMSAYLDHVVVKAARQVPGLERAHLSRCGQLLAEQSIAGPLETAAAICAPAVLELWF